jgi:hypothetical protein
MRYLGRSALAATILLAAACKVEPVDTDDGPAEGGGGGSAGMGGAGGSGGTAAPQTVRIGQFNLREMQSAKLMDAADEQATAAAAVLARFAPDIVSINELQFDMQGYPSAVSPGAPANTPHGGFNVAGAENARRLADRVAAAGGPTYSDTLLTVGNSGYYWEGDTLGLDWYILRGWGEFPGRFNTAVLSRFPILVDEVRVISDIAWEDIPDNKIAQMKAEIGLDVPPGFPVFEKSLNIVPVQVGASKLYLVLLHPVTPAYDPINPYRNHDELRALRLFLDGELAGVEPLPAGAKFMIIGDLNADPDDGDRLPGAIAQVLSHPDVVNHFPAGSGTKGNNGQFNSYLGGCGLDDGSVVEDPTARFQLQLDYLLPSQSIGEPSDSLLFFPDYQTAREDFDLACRASDHRFLYVDVEL